MSVKIIGSQQAGCSCPDHYGCGTKAWYALLKDVEQLSGRWVELSTGPIRNLPEAIPSGRGPLDTRAATTENRLKALRAVLPKVPIVDAADIGFTAISTQEGLSQIRVTSIVQDDLGFLWLGTQYGLNRFDGYSFKVFTHEPGNPNSLSGVNVTALFKDRNGTLWIGCERFLDRMDPKQGSFLHYPIPAVKHISQDRNGQHVGRDDIVRC